MVNQTFYRERNAGRLKSKIKENSIQNEDTKDRLNLGFYI